MEEVRAAAMAYYENMSVDQKESVRDFYRSLDANGDGKVTRQEYLYALKKAGWDPNCLPSNLFEVLDKNDDGTLDLEECITFYYMISARRLVTCDACGSYMLGLHFLCVECYNSDKERTYDLCCSCYRNNKFNHVHSYFLDNFALLRGVRTQLLEGNTLAAAGRSSSSSNKAAGAIKTSEMAVHAGTSAYDAATSAYDASDAATSAYDAADAIASVASFCTIM